MALIKEKTVTLSGRSVINNVEVARFSAQVVTDVNSTTTTSTYINNQAAYLKNIKQVRADADAFNAYARAEEDKLFAETADNTATKK